MKALIIFDSVFGHTQKIAEAIASAPGMTEILTINVNDLTQLPEPVIRSLASLKVSVAS